MSLIERGLHSNNIPSTYWLVRARAVRDTSSLSRFALTYIYRCTRIEEFMPSINNLKYYRNIAEFCPAVQVLCVIFLGAKYYSKTNNSYYTSSTSFANNKTNRLVRKESYMIALVVSSLHLVKLSKGLCIVLLLLGRYWLQCVCRWSCYLRLASGYCVSCAGEVVLRRI